MSAMDKDDVVLVEHPTTGARKYTSAAPHAFDAALERGWTKVEYDGDPSPANTSVGQTADAAAPAAPAAGDDSTEPEEPSGKSGKKSISKKSSGKPDEDATDE